MKLRIRWGRVVLVCFLLLVLLTIAAFLAPEIKAEGMRKPLADALERALGRKAEFREVRLQLWPAPGLTALDLVIPEDPAFGLEPLAYVGEFQASIRWTSFFTGELSLSSVRMLEASVNLARREGFGWNFPRFLARMAEGVRRGSPPQVEIRGGRINFRDGVLKSVYFLNNVDLDLDPPGSPSGDLRWSYEASPARTDRAEQGFGRFSGRGRWFPSSGPAGRLELDLELERSVIGEVLTLILGHDPGVQGQLLSKAFLDGPLDQLRLRGEVELADVARPALFGLLSRNWSMAYEGALNLPGGSFELHTVEGKTKTPSPLALHIACSRLLTDPQWEAEINFDRISAPELIDVSRRLGARIPPGLRVEGQVLGSARLARGESPKGSLELKQAQVALAGSGPLAIESAQLSLDGASAALAPAEVRTPAGNTAELSGSWNLDTDVFSFRMKSGGLDVSELLSGLAAIEGVEPLPVVSSCSSGRIEGAIEFTRNGAGEPPSRRWSADLNLTRAACEYHFPSGRLSLDSALLSVRGDQWSLRKAIGTAGSCAFQAEALYRPSARRPLRVNLQLDTAAGNDIEGLFRPALTTRRGLLERTFRRPPPPPQWLESWSVEGSLRVSSFSVGPYIFTALAGQYFWDGANLELPALTARIENALFDGRLDIRLGGLAPQYRARGRLSGLEWSSALWDGELDLRTESLGPQWMSSLRADGPFSVRNLPAGGEDFSLVSGCLDFDARRPAQRLKLTCLDIWTGSEVLSGQGSVSDGRLTADLASPRRAFRLSGPLSPLELEKTELEPPRAR